MLAHYILSLPTPNQHRFYTNEPCIPVQKFREVPSILRIFVFCSRSWYAEHTATEIMIKVEEIIYTS
jgi:hypothetical protein